MCWADVSELFLVIFLLYLNRSGQYTSNSFDFGSRLHFTNDNQCIKVFKSNTSIKLFHLKHTALFCPLCNNPQMWTRWLAECRVTISQGDGILNAVQEEGGSSLWFWKCRNEGLHSLKDSCFSYKPKTLTLCVRDCQKRWLVCCSSSSSDVYQWGDGKLKIDADWKVH